MFGPVLKFRWTRQEVLEFWGFKVRSVLSFFCHCVRGFSQLLDLSSETMFGQVWCG